MCPCGNVRDTAIRFSHWTVYGMANPTLVPRKPGRGAVYFNLSEAVEMDALVLRIAVLEQKYSVMLYSTGSRMQCVMLYSTGAEVQCHAVQCWCRMQCVMLYSTGAEVQCHAVNYWKQARGPSFVTLMNKDESNVFMAPGCAEHAIRARATSEGNLKQAVHGCWALRCASEEREQWSQKQFACHRKRNVLRHDGISRSK
eukprot:1161509-Pelagomonas_calceolata.AAC.3